MKPTKAQIDYLLDRVNYHPLALANLRAHLYEVIHLTPTGTDLSAPTAAWRVTHSAGADYLYLARPDEDCMTPPVTITPGMFVPFAPLPEGM